LEAAEGLAILSQTAQGASSIIPGDDIIRIDDKTFVVIRDGISKHVLHMKNNCNALKSLK